MTIRISGIRPWRALLSLGVLTVAGGCDHPSVSVSSGPLRDTQSACDSAIAGRPASPVRLEALVRGRATAVTAEVPTLGGGSYDASTGQLWVLDRSAPSVAAIGSAGSEEIRWGRSGEGPGDLFVLPFGRPGHRIALLGDRVFVLDSYRLSVFTRTGRFLGLASVGNPFRLAGGASLVALSDSSALLMISRFRSMVDTDFASRATTAFVRARLDQGKVRLDTLPLILKDPAWYSGGVNRAGIPFYNSFVFSMGETAAAYQGQLLGAGYAGFGYCLIDPSTSRITGATHVAAARRATTDAERRAVHAAVPAIDDRNPDGTNWGGSWISIGRWRPRGTCRSSPAIARSRLRGAVHRPKIRSTSSRAQSTVEA